MAAPFKLSFTTKTGLNPLKKPSSSTSKGEPPAKRPRLLGDEPEEKDETIEITAWDATAGGAIGVDGKKEEKGPLVIPALPNRGSWASLGKSKGRDAAAGKTKGETDKENHNQKKAKPEEEESEEQPASYGLTIMRKSPAPPSTRPDGAAEATTSTTTQGPETEEDAHLTEEQRLEKRALAALLNPDASADKTVIPIHPDEEAAFSHDYASAPDAPDLDDYAAVPVEGFGAALLRGMGWKDGEEIGRKRVGGSTTASSANKKNGAAAAKPHEIKRRPEFLGIGAKEDKVVGGKETTGWKNKPRKDGEAAGGYVPVMAKIGSTGELLTMEEFEERQKLGEEKEDGKERDRDRERDRERDRDRRRDRHDDDEYEEEKRRERKRRERERERDRDRTPDSKTSKDDRRRDRDRDYNRDRRRDDDRDSRDSREKRDSRDRDRERRKVKERERDRRRDDYDSYDEERRREKRRERERRDRDGDRERDRDSDERRKRRREDEVEGADDRKKRYR